MADEGTRHPHVEAWAVVASFRGEEEARLLAGRLEAEGIPARIDPESQHSYYGQRTNVIVGRPFDVLVPENREADARALVEDIERA